MAEYTDITKTGPLTGQQLKQQNNDNYNYPPLKYTPGVGPVTGPILTPEEHISIEESYRKKYVVPSGVQLNNNYDISTSKERKKWWEEEGRKKYASRFNDASLTKNNEFTDAKLERLYRNILFKKEFGNLPEYNELKKMSGDERDSFYAYWRGRVDNPITYKIKGKEYPIPGTIKSSEIPYNFSTSPEGREAGRILADLNYYFGQNFDNWTNEERKQFYNEWDVKNWSPYNNSYSKAVEEYPELKPNKQFKSQAEVDNYLKTLYSRYEEAQELASTIQNLNPKTTTRKWSADTASIFNPAGLDSLAQVINIASPKTIAEEQNKLAEVANKESKARIKEYEKEYLQQHWYSTDKYKQAQEEAEYWNIRGQKRRANSYLTPSNKLLKEAHEYALDKEDEYQISQLPEEEKSKYVTRKEALAKYKEEYIKKSDETSFPFNIGLNSVWRINGNEDASFPFAFFPFSKERAAEKYAEEKYAREFVKTDKIEPEQNIYASGMSRSQIEQAVQNFSDIYQKFNGSDWMPENEIPYDEIYQETKSLWESGNWREAIYRTDKIIENEVIDPHQSFFKKDNLGNMSSGKAALTQFYTMGVESLVESATAIPSLVVGAIQAFNPDDIQEEGYMNYFDRMLDNALHNDWLGVLSNQNVSDWAAQASEDAIIYGEDFNSLIASGAGTLGAQVGNFLMFAAGGLESKAAKALMRNAATSTSRSVLRNIVNEGNLAKRQLQLNKAISNSNLFRANYGEAAQQALEGERQIYETYNEKKWELIDSYTPKDLPQLVRQEGDKEVYANDYEFSYTQEEYNEALKHDLNFKAWSLYKQGLGPHPDEDEYEFNKRVSLRAQGIHIFNEKHPNYDDAVELNARRESAVNLGTQTTLLLGFDKLFGGLDKWTLDFAMGRRALKPKDLIGRIKGVKIGDLKPNTSWLKGAWTVAQNPVMETITEVGQQTGSALTKQIAEHNIDSFLENQLYGNGLASWAASSYEGIYNLDKEEFFRDAEIKRTILQTLLTTPLMPVFGGYRNRTSRGQNQSWVSRALENIHYYSPIKTTLGEQIYNIGQHNKQVNAAIDYINRWGADPINQANTRGLIGVQNYTEKMIADLINNDEVAYNNDVFSRTLSEAIMLSNTRETPFAQNRLQWLTNMSQIKSATNEQKAAAIQSMREEAAGNSAVRNLSDEQLLDLMETSSKKVLDTYNKVNEIVSSDERFTDGTYNWQQQSALLFNKLAREDLQTRIADKESRIQTAIRSLGTLDLGESKTSREKVEEGKTKNEKILLSGRDILALSPVKRAAMLSPKNLKSYSPEQQKIIQETINALNQVDGNILNDIINVGLEEYHLMKIEQDYKSSLQTPGWQSKRVKNKANKIKKAFTSEGNTKAFINRVSQANSVSEIYKSIMSEREANATRDNESIIDVEGVLNSIQDPALKQRVNEARKIERISNSIKAAIDRTTLTDDIKDDLINQVDRIASEALNSLDVSDISKYSIPITADGQDLSGTLNDILQTAAQNASNTQTVESEPVKPVQSNNDLPKSTDLGDRDVDTANPVNNTPLKRYTLDEAKEKLKELNESLVIANSATDNYQHDNLSIKSSILLAELEPRVPEGYTLQINHKSPVLEYQLVKTSTQTTQNTSQQEDKKSDLNDIQQRNQATQPVDRDGITKVAEVQFEEGGKVYSYPVRDENVQLEDGVNGPFSGTGRVINIRDVQDDAEAEFLIYQTDKDGKFKTNEQGDRIKRERPQFIDRHSQIEQNAKVEERPEEAIEQQVLSSQLTSIESLSTNKRYSNRTEYQQSVVDNNVTPAVTELDGTALSKGQFEPNRAAGQPNVMRQLQEEDAFDYVNKGALTEGDEIEFVVSQEQMPDGSTQVVIWEVTEPKDGVERTNPKWHGKQLLNVLDQTEVGGKRKELIDRIRTAYEEAGRPESFLYTTEKFTVDKVSHSIVPFRQTNPTEASSDETIETTNLQKGLTKQNGVWGISFFNKAKGRMVHVPIIFRQAKKVRNGATKILFSDKRMESKTIKVRKTAVGGTGEMASVSMVIPTPEGFVSVNSVYVLTKDFPNSNEKYKEVINNGQVGKTLIEKIKSHLKDIKTVSAFSDYLGFRRGYSEYIYNDRNHGRIDLGYRGSTGNTTLISAIPQNDKYVLVDPTDARTIINDNNGQGFTLDEVCKEYLTQLIDNPEADVTMRLNMEAIENKPEIITDLIDDGLLWAPDSLNARFTAANTQFSCSLDSEAKPSKPKQESPKAEAKQAKEFIKPAPVASSNNPSSTTEPVKKIQPKVDDSVELGSKVKRRKLKAGQSTQVRPEVPTTPISTPTTTSTNTSSIRTFETLSEKDKQHILTKVTQEEWDNLTREEQNNILNC